MRKMALRIYALVGAILFLFLLVTLSSGQLEFGSISYPTKAGEVLIVEDFSSAPGLVQRPVTIMYLDLGIAPGFYDKKDPLFLHLGPGPVSLADIRLTPSPFGPGGSRVGPGDGDLGLELSSFNPPYPRLVYADIGEKMGQYDPMDSVYVKTVPLISELAVGDVRLTWAGSLPPGTRVKSSDPDRGSEVLLLHPGPDFAFWSPLARGQVRFYNANGNVLGDPISLPIYDASDRVYFDMSVPSDPPRLFGYVIINQPRCTGSIGDFVWKDYNEDGVQNDGSDSGIEGALFKLCYLYKDDCWEIPSTETNDSGYYRFDGLCDGKYIVMVDLDSLPEEWRTPTILNAVDNGSLDSNADPGFQPRCST